jgi:hypothetical protein
MSSQDWIALGSVVIAAIAFVFSGLAYRLERRGQGTGHEQQLNDLLEKIQGDLAGLNQYQSAPTLETYAASNATMIALQSRALAARKLARRAEIELDWFQSMILAYAFTQVWDTKGAIEYWEQAVKVARTHHQAHVRSLTARAEFYYNRGLDDDWELARADFGNALSELRRDPERQGPDLAAQQVATMLVYQAGFEVETGDDPRVIALIADAFEAANAITVPWRRRKALEFVGGLTLMLQQKAVPPRNLLHPVAEKLSAREMGPDKFPADTAAMFWPPPDGGGYPAGGQPAGGQPAGLYGEQ